MTTKIKQAWDWIQSLLDLDGDVWMGGLTAVVIWRFIEARYGAPAISPSEAALYSSAVAAFAYSNRGPKL